MTSYIWLNGQFIGAEETSLSPQDRGFLLGDGFFTTIRCEDGIPICLQGHYQRLQHSASFFRIPFSYSFEQIHEIIEQLLQGIPNQVRDDRLRDKCHAELSSASQWNHPTGEIVVIRITITRGVGTRGIKPNFSGSPTLLIQAIPYTPLRTPVKAIISSLKRDELSPLNQHKHLGYQLSVLALQEALEKGYDDAIILNNRGNIVCSTTGNIFVLINGKIYTPPLRDGCLPGIERARLLQHYKRTHQPYEVRSLSRNDLERADQVFYTNSLVQKREMKVC